MSFKTLCCLFALTGSAACAAVSTLVKRQDLFVQGYNLTGVIFKYNELTSPALTCTEAILIHARGTHEPGNVGFIGGGLAIALKRLLPGLAVEGIEYIAETEGNYTPEGASADGIAYATQLFTAVATQCPRAAVIASGFSQGAALMHRSIETLPRAVQDHIAAVVLFGDSSNKRDKGRVKDFPVEKTMIICKVEDPVCSQEDLVTQAHMSYGDDLMLGANWAAAKVALFLKKSRE